MAGPCTGLTVLDFSSGMPGAITTLVLADFGAEVIKIEPPSGDPFRAHPGWLAWNRGKQDIVLDLDTLEGREQAQRLAERADVLVESFRPGETQRLGIDYATLSRTNPRLVYCSISGFGQKGRLSQLKAYEGVVAAKAGRMLVFAGQTQREGPVYAAVQTASWASSQAAVWGILATLRTRDKLGHGDWVQTSLLQGLIPNEGQPGLVVPQLVKKGRLPGDPLAGIGRVPTLQYLPARTKDGRWIQMANNNFRLFQSFIRAIGLWDIYKDERFKDAPAMTVENREILRDMILDRILEKTLDEWMEIFVEDGDVAAEPYLPTLEGMKHPQYVHNKHATEIDDPRVGKMKTVGPVAILSDTPGEVGAPAPDLGQHTAAVLGRLASQQRVPAPVAGAATNGRNGHDRPCPLDGITILDFATVIAGPYASAMLADLGARIIKFEPPEGDPIRTMGGGAGTGAIKMNAGKESIQVDLKTEEGIEILHKLFARVDGLIHNFRPGVPERLQMDYETVHKLNPRLVYLYAGGYGQTGPHSRRPAFHPLPGALMGGALTQAGKAMPPSSDTPLNRAELREVSRWLGRANEGNPDPNSSMAIATGMMLGLYARERTGQGQYILSTMIQANAWANADEAFDYAGRPPRPEPDAECYGLNALCRLYQAKEGWVFLECLFDEEWETFCRTVGRNDLLSDPRFRSAAGRAASDDALIAEIGKIFVSAPAAEWEARLTAVDLGCVQADANTVGDFFLNDPHSHDNGLIAPAVPDHARFGDYIRHGALVQFEHQGNRYGPGVLAGQHTRPILAELGYDEDQIELLYAQGVVLSEEIKSVVAR